MCVSCQFPIGPSVSLRSCVQSSFGFIVIPIGATVTSPGECYDGNHRFQAFIRANAIL